MLWSGTLQLLKNTDTSSDSWAPPVYSMRAQKQMLRWQRALQDKTLESKNLHGEMYCGAMAPRYSYWRSQALEPSINTAAKLTLITEISTVKHSTWCGNNRYTLESSVIQGIKSWLLLVIMQFFAFLASHLYYLKKMLFLGLSLKYIEKSCLTESITCMPYCDTHKHALCSHSYLHAAGCY